MNYYNSLIICLHVKVSSFMLNILLLHYTTPRKSTILININRSLFKPPPPMFLITNITIHYFPSPIPNIITQGHWLLHQRNFGQKSFLKLRISDFIPGLRILKRLEFIHHSLSHFNHHYLLL